MPALEWLTARPIAHRGLHDAPSGAIENTAAAFSAAIAGGYGMETDLQISADGEAMVHHDDALGRLTEGSGRLAEMTAAEIKAVRFKASAARILTLGELCDLVAGQAPLLLELKSRFDGDLRVAKRTVEVLSGYSGPVAVMSFDPGLIEAVQQAALFRNRVGQPVERAKAKPGLATAHTAEPSTISRLFGQGFASCSPTHGTHIFRTTTADLDGPHRRGSETRDALGRPDHIRGLETVRPLCGSIPRG
jgi:glycerophosphoryl diester phosphodiesterase